MASERRSDSAPPAGAPPTAAQLHHHEMRFLKALELLLSTGRVRSVGDLIRYAEQDRQAAAADFLRGLKADNLPVDLCYDALSVHTRIVAHKRNVSVLSNCQGKRVGLVMPLPPHVLDAFTSLTKATLIVPDGHHLPHHLEQRLLEVVQGSRAAREIVPTLDVLVFEVFRAGNAYSVDASVADIADLRIVPESTQLVVHVRPHQNPEDIAFDPELGRDTAVRLSALRRYSDPVHGGGDSRAHDRAVGRVQVGGRLPGFPVRQSLPPLATPGDAPVGAGDAGRHLRDGGLDA